MPELVCTAQCDIGSMATPWPQVAAWPNDPREQAAYLSDYLRKALLCIDSAGDQPVPKPLVKTMITKPSRGCFLRDSGDAACAAAPFDRPCTGADPLL